jgi:uncharacterized protein
MFRIIIPAILSCYLFSCKAQTPPLKVNEDNNTLLWQVSGNGLSKPSYIFGTFHLMCKDDIHLSEQLKKAMQSSNEVYMELKIDDPAIMLGGLLYMNMKGDTTLKDLYTSAEFKKVESYFSDSLQTPLSLLVKMKPNMLVALLYPKMMDCSLPASIEEELAGLAKEYKKEIKGLETIEFQASVFDSIPYKAQAKELLKNIDSFQTYKKQFADMLSLYKKQQLDSLSESLDNDPDTKDYEDVLVNNRNKNWVSQLKVIMKKESVFVAVGAGHLPGKKGLISLLKEAGFTVNPLVNK